MMLPAAALLVALMFQQGSDSVVGRAKDVLTPLTDSATLHQAGYFAIGFGGGIRDLTPFQGQHWLAVRNFLVPNPPLDLARPLIVMYLPVRDSLIPIGVAHLRRTRAGTPQPATESIGTSADWHTHIFCRGAPGEGNVLADGLDDCTARGGTPAPNQINMVHVWTVPNPDGAYGHDNPSLPFIATGLKAPAAATREDRLFAVALGESYGAKLTAGRRIELLAERAGRTPKLETHRAVLRALVPKLRAAERASDAKRFERLRKEALETWTALAAEYRATATTPELQKRFDDELEQLLGAGHHHHAGD